ncbi:hypothetical protein KC19_6G108100 [Ceratodon purpureus]|uniref:Uncharacterized protein n=1 Tax=Ceratodon purpureus TaxID=3225 RepID=A0A8T0HHG5_CERPU|nr:hypothetical protein KC19_6G108100 [Ceratodon purpureus]
MLHLQLFIATCTRRLTDPIPTWITPPKFLEIAGVHITTLGTNFGRVHCQGSS